MYIINCGIQNYNWYAFACDNRQLHQSIAIPSTNPILVTLCWLPLDLHINWISILDLQGQQSSSLIRPKRDYESYDPAIQTPWKELEEHHILKEMLTPATSFSSSINRNHSIDGKWHQGKFWWENDYRYELYFESLKHLEKFVPPCWLSALVPVYQIWEKAAKKNTSLQRGVGKEGV